MRSGSNRIFKAEKVTTLSPLSIFLTGWQKNLAGTILRGNLKNPGQSSQLKVPLTKTGLTGLLEGAAIHSADVVFRFLGAIVEKCCGHELPANATDVCTK